MTEAPEIRITPEIPNFHESVGLQARILISPEALNPEKAIQDPAIEIKDRVPPEVEEIIEKKSVDLRTKYWEQRQAEGERLSSNQQVVIWAQESSSAINHGANREHRKHLSLLLNHVLGTDLDYSDHELTSDNMKTLYNIYFKKDSREGVSGFTQFKKDILDAYEGDFDKLEDDIASIQWISTMFGIDIGDKKLFLSEIIAQAVYAEAEVRKDKDGFIQRANQNNKVNNLNNHETELLEYIYEPRTKTETVPPPPVTAPSNGTTLDEIKKNLKKKRERTEPLSTEEFRQMQEMQNRLEKGTQLNYVTYQETERGRYRLVEDPEQLRVEKSVSVNTEFKPGDKPEDVNIVPTLNLSFSPNASAEKIYISIYSPEVYKNMFKGTWDKGYIFHALVLSNEARQTFFKKAKDDEDIIISIDPNSEDVVTVIIEDETYHLKAEEQPDGSVAYINPEFNIKIIAQSSYQKFMNKNRVVTMEMSDTEVAVENPSDGNDEILIPGGERIRILTRHFDKLPVSLLEAFDKNQDALGIRIDGKYISAVVADGVSGTALPQITARQAVKSALSLMKEDGFNIQTAVYHIYKSFQGIDIPTMITEERRRLILALKKLKSQESSPGKILNLSNQEQLLRDLQQREKISATTLALARYNRETKKLECAVNSDAMVFIYHSSSGKVEKITQERGKAQLSFEPDRMASQTEMQQYRVVRQDMQLTAGDVVIVASDGLENSGIKIEEVLPEIVRDKPENKRLDIFIRDTVKEKLKTGGSNPGEGSVHDDVSMIVFQVE